MNKPAETPTLRQAKIIANLMNSIKKIAIKRQ